MTRSMALLVFYPTRWVSAIEKLSSCFMTPIKTVRNIFMIDHYSHQYQDDPSDGHLIDIEGL
jgi:hypothetical protein